MSIVDKIKKQLEAQGSISLAQYMNIALLDEEFGYYTTKNPFGKSGDFITAPEISQIFGEIIGAWVANKWLDSGSIQAAIVEFGGGRGTLMKDLLRATKNVKDFHTKTEVVMVEASEKLAQIQKTNLIQSHSKISLASRVEQLPNLPCFIIANEFFDALPNTQFIYKNNEWHERRIALSNGLFSWLDEKCKITTPEGYKTPKDGDIFEHSVASISLMEKICEHVANFGGAIIAIDYGYTKPAYGNSLQAIKNHKFSNIFENIGNADITTHVNFYALSIAAKKHGLESEIKTQREFLMANGATLRAEQLCKNLDEPHQEMLISGLNRLISPDQMGELFKVITIS